MLYSWDDVFFRASPIMARGVIRLSSFISDKNVSASIACSGPSAWIFPPVEAILL
jgi:hypothetical protein